MIQFYFYVIFMYKHTRSLRGAAIEPRDQLRKSSGRESGAGRSEGRSRCVYMNRAAGAFSRTPCTDSTRLSSSTQGTLSAICTDTLLQFHLPITRETKVNTRQKTLHKLQFLFTLQLLHGHQLRATEARRFWVSETSLKNGFVYFTYLTLCLTTSYVKILECCKRLLLKPVFPENKFSFTDSK